MLWTDTTPAMFDTDAKPVQEALFAAPDACGTPDLFDSAETAPATDGLMGCPRCESRELPAYLARHIARHDRADRDHAERVRLDAAARATYGPVRP